MSLGFARDSILDLAQMAKEHEDQEDAGKKKPNSAADGAAADTEHDLPGDVASGGGGGGGGSLGSLHRSNSNQSMQSIQSTGSGHGNTDSVVPLPKGGVYFSPNQSRSITAAAAAAAAAGEGGGGSAKNALPSGGGGSGATTTTMDSGGAAGDGNGNGNGNGSGNGNNSFVGRFVGGERRRQHEKAASASAAASAASATKKSPSSAYSAFTYGYAEYADYYAEAEAMTSHYAGGYGGYGADGGSNNALLGGAGGSKMMGGVGGGENSNLFCCLLAPWSKGGDQDDQDDGAEASTVASTAASSTAASSVASTNEKEEESTDEDDALLQMEQPPLNPNDSIDVTKARKLGLVSSAAAEEEDVRGGGGGAAVEEEKKGEEDGPEEDGDEEDDDEDDDEDEEGTTNTETMSTASGDTDVYGERLSDKDRQAVLARLRLSEPAEVSASASPGSTAAATGAAPKRRTATKSVPPPPSERPKKGILKKRTSTTADGKGSAGSNLRNTKSAQSKSSSSSASTGKDRRSLFPTYSPRRAAVIHPDPDSSDAGTTGADSGADATTPIKSVNFSAMARVVTVTARSDMTYVEKSQIWWQRSDYDDFKKTGRIIARAILQGGSEVWLTSNNAWERRQQSRHGHKAAGGGEDDYNRALRQYAGEEPSQKQQQSSAGGNNDDDAGSKWWCKFGHSRRGLEHIASMEEGRQRQRNVNTSIRAIMDEQRGQRMNHRKDPVKLARVAAQYTSWARDLALAAGAADAEAVRTNFGQNAKTRAHYLQAGVGGGGGSGGMPFMTAAGESTQAGHRKESSNIAPDILDANTSTHIRLQRKDSEKVAAAAAAAAAQQQQQQSAPGASGGAVRAPSSAEAAPPSATPPPAEGGAAAAEEEDGTPEMGVEAIHDPDLSHESISKKAAGFNQHSDENVDMSAVLTGMGPVHKKHPEMNRPPTASVGAH